MAPECDEEIDDENDGDEPVQGELDEHGNPKIFCICRKPERPNMIGCDFCDEWFHYNCLNLTRSEAKELTTKEWTCPNCELKKNSGFEFFKWANPGLFFVYFWSFSIKQYIFYNK